MTGTNHALTGAVIALTISQPVIAIVLAFTSHFVLDTLPHFGEKFGERKKLSKTVWMIDISLASILVLSLLATQPLLVLIGAVAAMSPDFAWVYRFSVAEKFGTLAPQPTNTFNRFHEDIQKLESRVGLFVELIWLVVFGIIVSKLV